MILKRGRLGVMSPSRFFHRAPRRDAWAPARLAKGRREGCGEMRSFLCWLLGHDRMTTSTRHRVCLRCGQRETRRDFGHVIGWEEVARRA